VIWQQDEWGSKESNRIISTKKECFLTITVSLSPRISLGVIAVKAIAKEGTHWDVIHHQKRKKRKGFSSLGH
jgi:hypothetical protein